MRTKADLGGTGGAYRKGKGWVLALQCGGPRCLLSGWRSPVFITPPRLGLAYLTGLLWNGKLCFGCAFPLAEGRGAFRSGKPSVIRKRLIFPREGLFGMSWNWWKEGGKTA